MQNDCTEVWRDITGYEGFYQVSNFGRVKSLVRKKSLVEIILKPQKQGNHLYISLRKWGPLALKAYVHRLVLETFVGPCPKGMECCHNDGNGSNNKIENLRWDTRLANIRDKAKHGTQTKGESHPSAARFKQKDIDKIRALYATGNYSQYELAAMYGVVRTYIQKIINRKIWK